MCVLVFMAVLPVHQQLHAQSKAPTRLKTEQGGEQRRKASERVRKRKSKGNIKSKSKILEKAYYKKKSSQSNFPGNIWIDPKPKDFTAIKERVEKNPSRKNLKAQKNRQAYFRASSNEKNKSFGSAFVPRQQSRLNYRYASKAILKSKGNSKSLASKSNYRRSSRKIQRHSGNIFVQPEATKRDFNEIKTG